MAYTRKPSYSSKRKIVRKAPARRAPLRRMPSRRYDGRNTTCTMYMEAESTGDAARTMSYSIGCDPSNLLVTAGAGQARKTAATDLGLGISDGAGTYLGVTNRLESLLFDREKTMWNTFRINSVQIKVTVDKDCQDNPLIFLQQKGTGASKVPPANMKECMSQAHKSHIVTDSRRQFTYGHVSRGAQEKEFITTVSAAEMTNLQVFQLLEAPPAGTTTTCLHRIELTFNLSWKDSKAPSLN